MCVCVCVCVCVWGGGGVFLSILVVVAIFDIGTIFITRPPPSVISALCFIVRVCILFSIPVIVTILILSEGPFL